MSGHYDEMRTMLVFAGNYSEFKYYIKNEFGHTPMNNRFELLHHDSDGKTRMYNFVYMSSSERTFGYADFEIIKIGTWYQNDWIQRALKRLEAIKK